MSFTRSFVKEKLENQKKPACTKNLITGCADNLVASKATAMLAPWMHQLVDTATWLLYELC
jgi:hypothetical protein